MEIIVPEVWLQKISGELNPTDYEMIKQAVTLAQLPGESNKPPGDQSSFVQGLITANILHQLHLDSATLAAAILHSKVPDAGLTFEHINEHLGLGVAKLIRGTQRMASISDLYQGIRNNANYYHNLDNIRKMFLAMVDDIRIVLIKLAEQLGILRMAGASPAATQKQLATETMAIYAPLTNRLGIAQLKWELEDLAFRYLDPDKYQEIATALEQHFPECHRYVEEVTTLLQAMLLQTAIKNFHVTGRTKHIYSIYRKMNRKKSGLEGIYDVSAVRIFVPTVNDCYMVLSLVHNTWQYIPSEFDDYIAAPKANGYRSIHTAVYGPQNRVIEIQIRTYDMHRQAELGIAAHWVYKEGKQEAHYQAKLSWLRQVMAWQQEIVQSEKNLVNLQQIFNDHVYVFTPEGDILELPKGASPIDFAYRIHTELGHHCCGAKVNNNIMPLTYTLKTGDRIEILTARDSHPSRDWLIPSLRFLHTARARSKVLHWFKKQSQAHNIIQGQELLNKEIKRLNLNKLDLKRAADKLKFKTSDDLIAALGSSSLKFTSILHALGIELDKTSPEHAGEPTPAKITKSTGGYISDINIQGIGNLLAYPANCCNPSPQQPVIGYITQGRGVAIHLLNCSNVLHTQKLHPERFIVVSWGKTLKK